MSWINQTIFYLFLWHDVNHVIRSENIEYNNEKRINKNLNTFGWLLTSFVGIRKLVYFYLAFIYYEGLSSTTNKTLKRTCTCPVPCDLALLHILKLLLLTIELNLYALFVSSIIISNLATRNYRHILKYHFCWALHNDLIFRKKNGIKSVLQKYT